MMYMVWGKLVNNNIMTQWFNEYEFWNSQNYESDFEVDFNISGIFKLSLLRKIIFFLIITSKGNNL